MIDEHSSKIFTTPLVENPGEKIAILFRVDRPVGDHRIGMIRMGFGTAEHRKPGGIPGLRGRRFKVLQLHNRDELDVRGIQLAAQKAIDVEWTRSIEAVHASEG